MSLSGNWDAFVDSVKLGVKELAKNTVDDAITQAESDAKAFLESSGDSLRRWGDALANDIISKEDFEFLVGGQKDLAKMHALKARGLSLTKLERFRTGLLSLIVGSAMDAIGI